MAGSIPPSSATLFNNLYAQEARSSGVEHLSYKEEVVGSTPAGPTKYNTPVAQPGMRAAGYEPVGRRFKSFRGCHTCGGSLKVKPSAVTREVVGARPTRHPTLGLM